MSPTSYQAAPPREFMIADANSPVKRIRHTRREAMAVQAQTRSRRS